MSVIRDKDEPKDGDPFRWLLWAMFFDPTFEIDRKRFSVSIVRDNKKVLIGKEVFFWYMDRGGDFPWENQSYQEPGSN